MERLQSLYGIYPWFPEHGLELVHPDDLAAFSAIRPSSKVFECVARNDYLTLRYAGKQFRVRPDLFKSVSAPRFSYGERVLASHNGKKSLGIVVDIEWHHKDGTCIYYLAFDGKRSSRRHSDSELGKAE